MVRNKTPLMRLIAHRISVRYHDKGSGAVYMTHEHPRLNYQIVALVDTDHVLEMLTSDDCRPGAWLNVTGYTTSRRLSPGYGHGIAEKLTKTPVYSEVGVRAVMVWNAGSLDLGLYERALEARKSGGTTG
jgi:Telomere capping, CST complex subunit